MGDLQEIWGVLLCSDVSLAAHNVISLQRDLGGMWDRERPFL